MRVLPSSHCDLQADAKFPAADGKGTFVVRKGEMAVANVASLHGDERWFEDPKTFRIDLFMVWITARTCPSLVRARTW